MHLALIALDLGIILCAAASGVFWYLASGGKIRRIKRADVLDSHYINRIIVAFNRAQILNRRAALATSATGMLATVRLSIDLF